MRVHQSLASRLGSRLCCALLMALLVVAMTISSLAQAPSTAPTPSTAAPTLIPGPGEGYEITQTNESQKAPSGFEGKTDKSTQTAVGNTPATTGKRVVAKFTLGNQVKTCPQADGTTEGEGVFSVTVDSTNAQASGTSTNHIEMRAKAKYKGQVADNAYLDGPVKADIDYTYTVSGTFRGASGALATPAGSNVTQHVTIPFVVGPAMTAPSFGAFAGGDPTHGHLSDAFSAGTALAYWAGVYYSIAQTKWRTGMCVQISFNPPSNTVQPALGAQVTVKAEVKTKGGESVKARFQDAHGYAGGSVTPSGGPSDVGSPLPFTYTAPNQKSSKAGFGVVATSRAGIAEGDWIATLGTGWSGQISCTRSTVSEAWSSEQQSASGSEVTQLTIELKDGAGSATGFKEVNSMGVNLRPVARQGYVFDNSQSTNGIAEGTSPATVEVELNRTNGTYSIDSGYRPFPPGKYHSSRCDRNGCREEDLPFYIDSCMPPGRLYGQLTNPNQLRGSINDSKTYGQPHSVTQTLTVTWNLARQGTSQ